MSQQPWRATPAKNGQTKPVAPEWRALSAADWELLRRAARTTAPAVGHGSSHQEADDPARSDLNCRNISPLALVAADFGSVADHRVVCPRANDPDRSNFGCKTIPRNVEG